MNYLISKFFHILLFDIHAKLSLGGLLLKKFSNLIFLIKNWLFTLIIIFICKK